MVKYEDECVGCPKELGCMGSACPNRNVPHFYCDKCGDYFNLYDNCTDKFKYCPICGKKIKVVE